MSSCGSSDSKSTSKKPLKSKDSELILAKQSFVDNKLRPMKVQIQKTIKAFESYQSYEEGLKNFEDSSAVDLKKLRSNFLDNYAEEAVEIQNFVSDSKANLINLKETALNAKKELEKEAYNFSQKRQAVESCYNQSKVQRNKIFKDVKTYQSTVARKKKNLDGHIENTRKLAEKYMKNPGFNIAFYPEIIERYPKYLNALSKALEEKKPKPAKHKSLINGKGNVKKLIESFTVIEKNIIDLYKYRDNMNNSIAQKNKKLTRHQQNCKKKENQLKTQKNNSDKKLSRYKQLRVSIQENQDELIQYVQSRETFYGEYKKYQLALDKINGVIKDNLSQKVQTLEDAKNQTVKKYSPEYLKIYQEIAAWISANEIDGKKTIELINDINTMGNNSKELQSIKSEIFNILNVANKIKAEYAVVNTQQTRVIASWLSQATGVDVDLSSGGSFQIKMPTINIPKISLPKINLINIKGNLPKIEMIKVDLNLNLDIKALELPDLQIADVAISEIVELDFSDISISDIEIEIPEIPMVSDILTTLSAFGQSFIDDISSFEITIGKTEIIHIQADIEKDLKSPEDILKNSLKQVKDAKEDADRELTNAYQNLKKTAQKANEDVNREGKKGLKKVGAALEAAGQPKNLARIAIVYAASVYGGPMGSALANSILDKLENPKMSEQAMFNSFVVGAAAGYAAQNVTAVDVDMVKNMPNATSAITRNLTTDLGNVIIKGQNYSTEQFLSSLVTGAVNSNVGDDFLGEVIDSGINNAATYTINTTIYKQDFDEDAFEKALYEGMANGFTRETIHSLMENYVLPPAEERGERFDKKLFDAISDLLMAQAQSISESIANKQFEKFDKLESSEQKQIMQELAQIKEELYAEFLPSVVSA